MKHTLLALVAVALTSGFALAADSEEGFVSLMDGKTFSGWKVAADNPGTWKVEDGAFVASGPMCHLFYVGDEKPFKNFHFKAEVMTGPNSNGGIYFHTKWQEKGWPKAGFESQVNNTHSDWIKTGSLYGIACTGLASAQDNKWWLQEIIVEGRQVTVKVDGKIVIQYTEPKGAEPGGDFSHKINEGTFALQGHDPKSTIRYKNIRVKRLP